MNLTDASRRVQDFLNEFRVWAQGEEHIEGALLVGSHAKGTAGQESDLDLLILSSDPSRYLNDGSWTGRFGAAAFLGREDYGAVQSLRVRYDIGLEVEFAFAGLQWADVPVDPGTASVVSEGAVILIDKSCRLKEVLASLRVSKP